jgi:uncharacterized protein (DUF2141 family)
MKTLSLVPVLALAFSTGLMAESFSLTVNITNARSSNGSVLICAYKSAETYSQPQKAAACGAVQLKDGAGRWEVKDLPVGEYAISAMHDENSNQKMDSNSWGLPQEGYGASNNPKPRMGPPTWEETRFAHKAASQLELKLIYLN